MVLGVIDRIRRNHGLEHATVAVLLEGGARPPLAGYSTPAGYFIYARESTDAVTSAASEGLRRMAAGESALAISPYCGSNLVVAAVLAGLFSTVIMRGRKRHLRRIPLVAATGVAAAVLGRPLGMEVQRRYTTSADVEGLEISSVRCLRSGKHTVHWVGTRYTSRQLH